MKKGWYIGVIEAVIGGILVSPIDEAIVVGGTGGSGIIGTPIQAPATALIGLALVYDGLKRI
jgi:hypothetical protein